MSKVTAYAALAAANSADVLPVVDVSDTSMAATGTTKKMTLGQLRGALAPWQFTPEAYGAKGDGKVTGDAHTTSGSKVVTSATAAFTSADIGKTVMINGGNGTTSAPYVGVIASVQSGTQVTLTTTNAGATASNCPLVWGTDDTTAIVALFAADRDLRAGQ